MNCPFCGHDNLAGVEHCASCGEDLTRFDVEPKATGRLHGTLLGTLGDVGVLDPLVVSPESTVADAVELMRKKRHGSVLVRDDDDLVGIFTENDLVTRVPARGDLASISIVDVMTPRPRTYRPAQPITNALNAMALKGNRHLPIVDDDEHLQGFVSVRKVLAHIHREIFQ
jgi:CBS domain-containing protein